MSKALGDFFSTNHSSYRTTISHSFSYSKNIRDYTIVLKGPKVLSESSKTSLNLITNTNNSFCFEMFIECFIEIFRRNNLTSTALHELTDKTRSVFFDYIFKIILIVFNRLLRISELASVEAWNFSKCDMIWFFVMLTPFIRADLHAFSSNSMISSLKTNNTFLICMEFSHLHSQIVGFRPRIDKCYHT